MFVLKIKESRFRVDICPSKGGVLSGGLMSGWTYVRCTYVQGIYVLKSFFSADLCRDVIDRKVAGIIVSKVSSASSTYVSTDAPLLKQLEFVSAHEKKTRATPQRRLCKSKKICRRYPLPAHFL